MIARISVELRDTRQVRKRRYGYAPHATCAHTVQQSRVERTAVRERQQSRVKHGKKELHHTQNQARDPAKPEHKAKQPTRLEARHKDAGERKKTARSVRTNERSRSEAQIKGKPKRQKTRPRHASITSAQKKRHGRGVPTNRLPRANTPKKRDSQRKSTQSVGDGK